jgi:hypothetical protein
MNYLLFVYYDNTVNNSELKTNEIAKYIAEQMTSKEAKFMFGDKHAIFHFSTTLSIDEMGEWIRIANDDLNCFQFLIVPKPRSLSSNMEEENLNYLLSLKKSKPKKQTPPKTTFKYEYKPKTQDTFMDIADIILNMKKPEVCNMTLDELLDKISKEGLNSLSELEKQKLDEYSKSM